MIQLVVEVEGPAAVRGDSQGKDVTIRFGIVDTVTVIHIGGQRAAILAHAVAQRVAIGEQHRQQRSVGRTDAEAQRGIGTALEQRVQIAADAAGRVVVAGIGDAQRMVVIGRVFLAALAQAAFFHPDVVAFALLDGRRHVIDDGYHHLCGAGVVAAVVGNEEVEGIGLGHVLVVDIGGRAGELIGVAALAGGRVVADGDFAECSRHSGAIQAADGNGGAIDGDAGNVAQTFRIADAERAGGEFGIAAGFAHFGAAVRVQTGFVYQAIVGNAIRALIGGLFHHDGRRVVRVQFTGLGGAGGAEVVDAQIQGSAGDAFRYPAKDDVAVAAILSAPGGAGQAGGGGFQLCQRVLPALQGGQYLLRFRLQRRQCGVGGIGGGGLGGEDVIGDGEVAGFGNAHDVAAGRLQLDEGIFGDDQPYPAGQHLSQLHGMLGAIGHDGDDLAGEGDNLALGDAERAAGAGGGGHDEYSCQETFGFNLGTVLAVLHCTEGRVYQRAVCY